MKTEYSAVLAYLDLGTGSYIVQVMAASIMGALYVSRNFVKRVFQMVLGRFVSRSQNNEQK